MSTQATHCAPKTYDTTNPMTKAAAEKAAAECDSPYKTRAVKELLLDYPHAGRVFSKYGVDFCCGGNDTLEQACIVKGVHVGAVLKELLNDEYGTAAAEEGAAGKQEGTQDFRTMSFSQAAKHIVSKHHAYLREELPLLTALADKVNRVHGGRHPELGELREEVHKFREMMFSHMDEEEAKIFNELIADNMPTDAAATRKVLEELMEEHMEHGASLANMRRLTGGYVPPADGCNSYRSLFARLNSLEQDTHLHVSLENNFLFPRLFEHYKEL